MIRDVSVLATNVVSSVVVKCSSKKAPRERLKDSQRRFPNKADIYELTKENSISIADALDWLEIHKARNFKTEDGKRILNWKGACTNWCRSRERRRKEENLQ